MPNSNAVEGRERGSTPSESAVWLVIRVIATSYFITDLLESASNADQYGWPSVYVQALIVAGCVLLCWARPLGIVVSLLAVLGSLIFNPMGASNNLLITLPIVLLPVLAPKRAVAVLALLAGYSVAVPLRFAREHFVTNLLMGYVALTIGTLIGLAARGFLGQHRRELERIQQLEAQGARIRQEERSSLARELHDVVAHQLSIISLQIMGHRDSDDPNELREALDRVDDSARAALGELQLLLEVLRDDQPGANLDRLAEVSQPTVVALGTAETLRENGFRPNFLVPPEADRLEPSEQLTLSRAIQEGTTNILRHAPAGSVVTLVVTVTGASVRLEFTNPMPPVGRRGPLHEQSLGYGLRGIAERVQLIGGSLEVGAVANQWVIDMVLPRGSARRRAAAYAEDA